MRKMCGALLMVGVLVGSLVSFVGPAQAAGNSVRINVLAPVTSSAAAGAKAAVRPSVTTSGRVKVGSKTLTVRSAGKVIRSRVPSASLSAGTYRITTSVKYRTYKKSHGHRKYSRTHIKARTQTVTVTRPCATAADFASVVAGMPPVVGDTVAQVQAKMHTAGFQYNQPDGVIFFFLKCDDPSTPYFVGFDGTNLRAVIKADTGEL